MPAFQDLTGQPFGRLTVIKYGGRHPTLGGSVWICECTCGNVRPYRASALKDHHTRSCGCMPCNKIHGLSKTPEYKVWHGIIQRCYNPKSPNYKYYGARGITVCDEWRNSVETFYADMGPRTSPAHSIERRVNDLGYSPENCYWATLKEQNRNRRLNHLITMHNTTACLSVWLEVLGVSHSTFKGRKQRGWTDEQALLNLTP